MAAPVRGLSSMATKRLLADLGDVLRRDRSLVVHFDSAGGVEVARRIRAGVPADLAVLSEDAMAQLDADGMFVDGTLTPLFVSDVVAAVPGNAEPVPLSTEADLKAVLIGAGRIACSTGPSGKAVVDLLERWDLVETVRPKLVQVRPGQPVGTVLAAGAADLGFQQRTELTGFDGLRVLGPLPGSAAIRSTFSGAVLAGSTDADAAREVLDFLGAKDAQPHVLAAGMTSV